jgi:tRNA nucleotidyltransferase/poly(A) polymerase
VVGGCVRDYLLEAPTKDYDIATSATPDEIQRLFPRSLDVGKAFGVIKVPVPGRGGELEIATFREDLEYRDHRHPSKVRFSSPEEDARRRDFTVNALFFDPKTSRILDAAGGVEDLKAGLIRAIGQPDERFNEDALRLLRAVRFAARLGFAIEPATLEAIRQRARLIRKVSAERVRDELTAMWTGPRPDAALAMLSRLGLLAHVLPELHALQGLAAGPEGDVWEHLLRVVGALARQAPKRSVPLAWAAVLHEAGKPAAYARSGRKNFNGHELEGARLGAAVCDRLRLSRADAERVAAIVADHLKFRDTFQMREATLQRFVREPHFGELLALHRADAAATDGNLAYYEFCRTRLETLARSPETPRLLDGSDLIQLGLKPGPEFSEILRVVEDLALEGTLRSKEQALEYVVKRFVS